MFENKAKIATRSALKIQPLKIYNVEKAHAPQQRSVVVTGRSFKHAKRAEVLQSQTELQTSCLFNTQGNETFKEFKQELLQK